VHRIYVVVDGLARSFLVRGRLDDDGSCMYMHRCMMQGAVKSNMRTCQVDVAIHARGRWQVNTACMWFRSNALTTHPQLRLAEDLMAREPARLVDRFGSNALITMF
jgi:hypothetical protein